MSQGMSQLKYWEPCTFLRIGDHMTYMGRVQCMEGGASVEIPTHMLWGPMMKWAQTASVLICGRLCRGLIGPDRLSIYVP